MENLLLTWMEDQTQMHVPVSAMTSVARPEDFFVVL